MAITSANNPYDAVILDQNFLNSFWEDIKNIISSSSTWQQGDHLCLDASSHIIRVVTADTDASTFMGVADNSVTAGILVGPYPTGMGTIAAQQPQGTKGPLIGATFSRKIVAGDSLYPGVPLYLPATADTQTLTVTDTVGSGNYVGIYKGPVVASAVAGTLYGVRMGYRFASGNLLQFC